MSEDYTPILKREAADNAWLGLGDVTKIDIKNPLLDRTQFEIEHPGFAEMRLMRDPNYLSYAAEVLLDIQNLPEQGVVLEELWKRPFPMYIASRGFGKSFMLAEYALLKCALVPETKVVIVGAAFRQSKVIFEYMVTIWNNSPILRSICDNDSGPRSSPDRCLMRINDSWAMAVPLGDGSKIRGLRAHTIIADEFASIPPDIFETVVRGFTAVSAKPIDNVRAAARKNFLESRGLWDEAEQFLHSQRRSNQVIISGTADYDFKHYADYWKRYKEIIHASDDEKKLNSLFGASGKPKHFDPKDFIVIRIPYELIPEGFMDDKQVAQAKATVHSGIYQMEYGACFTSDSDGFFRRSLIEACVASDIRTINLPSGKVWFDAVVEGNSQYKYVYGIDPASEKDNFSIVILELREDHTRTVYTWTTNRKQFNQRKKLGLSREGDFYGYCARKIRDLMKTFPTDNIGIDAQGGGIAVMEALHDPAKLDGGEVLLWPIVEKDKKKDSDSQPGQHILHMCQFANREWTEQANHGLKKDMEDRVILFPRFDGISLALAGDHDNMSGEEPLKKVDKTVNEISIYDSLEDCVMEIEELKNELCTITMTRTGTGVGSRDRWDTPELVQANGKKGRLRKDRYSSFVMANMIARSIHRALSPLRFGQGGGFAKNLANQGVSNEQLYQGPAWFTQEAGTAETYLRAIRRNH